MADRTGQHFGNYQLRNLLGQGGFADVYLAEHIHLGTKAAVKVLHTQLVGDDITGFRNEARTIAQLEHPHIVHVLEFGLEETVPFLVMSYAPNGSLRQLHPDGTILPLTTALAYIKQIVEALQYAHDQKIIHCDIKPENILFGRHNELLLSDFGAALVAQSIKMQSIQEVIGTAAYMAPEVLQGHPQAASDQYALGIMTYEWLSGVRPFHGSFTTLISQHMLVPPPPLRGKNPLISPDVEQVVLTALAKEPSQRFASVRAFAQALERAAQMTGHETIQAPLPVSLPKAEGVYPASVQKSSASRSASALAWTLETRPTTTQHTPATNAPAAPMPYLLSVTETGQTTTESPPPAQPKQTVSRRAVLIGLGAAGLAVAGAGVTWLTLSHSQQATTVSQGQQPTVGTRLYTYTGHADDVASVAWSPNGKRIASGSFDQTVQVWNASNGSDAFMYRGHTNDVTAVAWSPDGKHIASGSWDQTVQVWNAIDGSDPFTYRGHSNALLAVVWSPDGQYIASGGDDQTVQVWHATTGSHVLTYKGHSENVNAIAWSPDGKRIASGSGDQTVQVWNAIDGSNPLTYTGHTDDVFAVAWSPNGQHIASASADKTIQVWNATDGSLLFTYKGHADKVIAVAWSPDGQRLASGSWDKTVEVWNATTGSHVFTYKGHSNKVIAVAWSPDGKRIASGSWDKTAQVWEAV